MAAPSSSPPAPAVCGLPPFTAPQHLALQICPKVTGGMSMIADCIIFYRVMVKTRREKRRVYDRLLLGMTIVNFFGSFGYFLSTWPIGNTDFCNFQGWVIQLNAATYWYNAMLATNFLLRIVSEWKEHEVEVAEPWMHVGAWLFPVVTSFVGLGLGMYGNATLWCWITLVPFDWARWAFYYAELWAIMIYCAVVMSLIVWKVHQSDMRAKSHQNGKAVSRHRMSRNTREVAIQGIFFNACFWLTWIFGSANRIQNAIVGIPGCAIFALMVLHSWFVPWQGFLNMLVYLFPRYRSVRRAKSEGSRDQKQVFWSEAAHNWLEDMRFIIFSVEDVETAPKAGTRQRRSSVGRSWIDSTHVSGTGAAPGGKEENDDDDAADDNEDGEKPESTNGTAPPLKGADLRSPSAAPLLSPLGEKLSRPQHSVKFASGHETVIAEKTPTTSPSLSSSHNTLPLNKTSTNEDLAQV